MITSLGLERADLVHLFVYWHVLGFFFLSSSSCQGLAAVCDFGTPWNLKTKILFKGNHSDNTYLG